MINYLRIQKICVFNQETEKWFVKYHDDQDQVIVEQIINDNVDFSKELIPQHHPDSFFVRAYVAYQHEENLLFVIDDTFVIKRVSSGDTHTVEFLR